MPEITDSEMSQYEALKRTRKLRLERLNWSGHIHWAARLSGLTLYGDTKELAIERLREASSWRVQVLFDKGYYEEEG